MNKFMSIYTIYNPTEGDILLARSGFRLFEMEDEESEGDIFGDSLFYYGKCRNDHIDISSDKITIRYFPCNLPDEILVFDTKQDGIMLQKRVFEHNWHMPGVFKAIAVKAKELGMTFE